MKVGQGFLRVLLSVILLWAVQSTSVRAQEEKIDGSDSLVALYGERLEGLWQAGTYEEYRMLLDSVTSMARTTQNKVLDAYCALWKNIECRLSGEYDSAFVQVTHSLYLARELQDTILLREVYFAFALLYQDTEDYMTALAAYRECLRMDSPRYRFPNYMRYVIYNNNAMLYEEQGNYDDAYTYYERAVTMGDFLALNYRPRLYCNMAVLAFKQKDTAKVVELLYKAYPEAAQMGDTTVLIDIHLALADIYLTQNKMNWGNEQIWQYETRFANFRRKGETDYNFSTLMALYTTLKQYQRAEEYRREVYLSLAAAPWPTELYRDFLFHCARLDSEQGKFQQATAYMDTILSIEANNDVVLHVLKQNKHDFDLLDLHQQNEETIRKLAKENELREQHRRRRVILLSIAFLLFAIILLHRYLSIHSRILHRTQMALLKELDYARQLNQKWGALENVLNNQRVDLEQSTALLQNLLDMLHSNSKKVTHNIEFVRDIQLVMLPDPELIQKAFGESFIIYQPRDIVSGDSYWYANAGPYEMLALVDCAGHGVPGALMSLIGHVLLNKIVKQWRLNDPAQVLTSLHDQIHENLSYQSTTYLGHYSMDLTLIRYEPSKRELVFSSASSSLYISTSEGVKRYRGSIMSAGSTLANCSYENVYLTLAPDTWVYLSSDGFTDQLNDHFRKYGSMRFQEDLRRMYESAIAAEDQRFFLLEGLMLHQGGVDQADDICVIGIHF